MGYFNDNGFKDLAATNFDAGTVSILSGIDGPEVDDFQFAEVSEFSVGRPIAVKVADLIRVWMIR